MQAHTIRDRVAFRSSLSPLKAPAFSLLDSLQAHPADVQIEALSLTFTILAQGAGLNPHELVERSRRQLSDAAAVRNPIPEAIEAYAQGELR
ncbi:hypothetical protein [Novosphingobium lindaniclasticum]|uniref:Uncharacterized protein n=1 Tax=Novosphingobium lindaniclasticum LE124 TaxID=1096930 RepID=T0HBL7_9SPHN|nr:hypothetical protein [Novosphingobium lindaniclasticum]EQB10392.1 hypothetical protein L284_17000 [Novosphingobium lindaniclasticum LE124]